MNSGNRSMLAVGCLVMGIGLLLPGSARAQMTLTPRIIQIDTFTCGALLALPSERQDRVLIFLNGYIDGARRQTTWDERAAAGMIERALAACKADPGQSALSVFMNAAAR